MTSGHDDQPPPSPPASAASQAGGSSWSPFRHRAFTILWVATVVSNIGTWMQNAAAGWLMTGLDPDPSIVALVQVATALPMFLFGLPAGALADILDRRHLLIVVQIALTVITAAFALMVSLNLVTPISLLAFIFLSGVGAALIAPTWQSIVPQLVPRADLQPAVALNSAGINVSRAIGPALAGVIIGIAGLAAPFWVNAFSNLGVIAALIWWRPTEASAHHLPAERFASAIRIGLRHARENPHLGRTLLYAVGFFIFASAYWALLPLVARERVAGGPELFGLLLGAIGVGAVSGALVLPRLKARLGADRLAGAGAAGTAVALALYGLARDPITALLASLVAGLSWIAVLATVNVSAQVALPGWVRGRGLALFVTVMFGSLSIGSIAWGHVARAFGVPTALFAAAVGLAVAVPILFRLKLQTGSALDLTPSMHWPAPVVSLEVDSDRGPVMVTVDYRVEAANRTAFLAALDMLGHQRRRDGAFDWAVFEDTAQANHFTEVFFLASWLEHMRQHERVTKADHALQDSVNAFHIGANPPAVSHFITPVRG